MGFQPTAGSGPRTTTPSADLCDPLHTALLLPTDSRLLSSCRSDLLIFSILRRYTSRMPDFEKLGVFYLGRPYDLATRQRGQGWLLYDSRDLVTHAVCVGMTGSGKTGLCLSLLEEAAIDGVPAIVIDPKGDLGNLLLTFPDLRPADFAPWVNPDDARRKGLSVEDFAAQQAELWKKGLAEWEQDGGADRAPPRRRRLLHLHAWQRGRAARLDPEVAGRARARDAASDGELFRERITTTVTSLLGLIGMDADPVKSRDHILLSTLMDTAWRAGRDMDLATLIQQVQSPPMTRVGVFDLESFYPAKERFGLAMALNNLLASPGFNAWMTGDPLDVQQLLYTADGKPRISIFSISHLGDAERMFFVSLLLNQVVGWMRAQGGTTSLRALVYMDEIAGYFPPVANPPSKAPLMTLLKQGRAFGLGVVLATQNPVDLDYKGLSNTGTWFLGRLQTERDKARVLEGLEGAAATAGSTFDKGKMEQTLAALGSRVFLMNNVHEDEPVVFETRWAMSYLRGPLGRQEIKRLMDAKKSEAAARQSEPAGQSAPLVSRRRSLIGSPSQRRLLQVASTPRSAPRLLQCTDSSRVSSDFSDRRPPSCPPASSSTSCPSAAPRRPGRGSSTRPRCSAWRRCGSPTRRRSSMSTQPVTALDADHRRPGRGGLERGRGQRLRAERPRARGGRGCCLRRRSRRRRRRRRATTRGRRRSARGSTARRSWRCSARATRRWCRSPARPRGSSACGCSRRRASRATGPWTRFARSTRRRSRRCRSGCAGAGGAGPRGEPGVGGEAADGDLVRRDAARRGDGAQGGEHVHRRARDDGRAGRGAVDEGSRGREARGRDRWRRCSSRSTRSKRSSAIRPRPSRRPWRPRRSRR